MAEAQPGHIEAQTKWDIEDAKWKEPFRPLNFYGQEAAEKTIKLKTEYIFLWKSKDESEGRIENSEDWSDRIIPRKQ